MANLKVDLSLSDGNLKQQLNQDKQAVNDFGKAVGNQSQQFAKALGSITNYQRKLTLLQREVVNLEMAWADMSAEQRKSDFGQQIAKQLTEGKEKAAQFKDQLIDTQNEIKQLSSDSFKTDALTQGIETVSTSMSAFVAVTELCGGSTEKLEDAIKKLILIQSVSAASVKVINSLQAQSALMLGVRKVQEAALSAAITIRTAAETRGTAAVKAATIAQTALNAVAKANPYVLLAAAVGTVATALFTFSGRTEKAAEKTAELSAEMQLQKKLAETYSSTLSNTYSELMTKYTELQTQWQQLSSEQQKTAWIEKNKSALNSLNLSVNSVADAERVFASNTDAVVESFVRRARAAARVAQLTELYRKQIELLDKKQQTEQAIAADAARSGRSAKEGDLIPDNGNWRNKRYGKVDDKTGKWRFSAKGAALYSGTDTTNSVAIQAIDREGKSLANQIEQVKNAIAAETKDIHIISSKSAPSEIKKTVEKAVKEKKIEVKIPEDKIGNQLQSLDAKNAKLQRTPTYSSYDIAVGNVPADDDLSSIQRKMDLNDNLLAQLRELQQEYAKLGDRGTDSYIAVGQEIEQLKDKQAELGEQAAKQTEQQKKQADNVKQWQDLGSAVGEVGGAFSSLGSSFKSPELNIAGTIAQAIASIIAAYTQAAASPAVTSTGWGWLGFAISGLAQVAAVVSQIHSMSGYAQGGIVSGGTYVGDRQVIRVNSGEAVLTQRDQSRFLRLLDGGSVTNSGSSYQAVEFKLRGSDLYGVLRNYSKEQGSVGKHIGIK